MKFEKFEDIIAWQKARELTREVYACTQKAYFGSGTNSILVRGLIAFW